MRVSDRVFGLVVIAVALGYIFSATGIREGFLPDPMGSRAFPYLIGGLCALCGLVIVLSPDADPVWPPMPVLGKLLFAVVVLFAYTELLKPMGFLAPTALAAGIVSYLIRPRLGPAIVTGVGLSVGLFVIFKYGLGLGLFPVPREWLG